jgi:small-conductance mechanosensitive channel
MPTFQSKKDQVQLRNHKELRVVHKTAAIVVAMMTLIAIPINNKLAAFSQTPQKHTRDDEARGQDIMAHLNSVIGFYRASVTAIQKFGEPNDIIYHDQAESFSSQIATFAFQSAKAEASLMTSKQSSQPVETASSGQGGEQQKLQAVETKVEKQLSDLKDKETALNLQIATAKPKDVQSLRSQLKQLDAARDLAVAMKDALQKIVGMSDAQGATGLAADIDRLQRSVPELDSKSKAVTAQLSLLDSARSSGVSSQAIVLFNLFETRRALDGLIRENDDLHKQALSLRSPISNLLRNLIAHGQQMSEQAISPVSPASPQSVSNGTDAVSNVASPQETIASITTAFKALSAASVPLSQEIIVLEQSRANLMAWQTSVDREYKSILHELLLRVLVIGIVLAIILGGGEVWRHATNKYIRDIRRRRQILIVRRVVIGFLSAIVVLFGFVTQFNSLATFAGFITAGIAVGLQTILLSVAAYFFIIGRYGVKVGDRITIASVTGDVIDVGLVRFYIMELAGSGTELNPTGRVAVFSNAVLFQAGTPLYKQMPGTEYAWHELIMKLSDTANYKMVCNEVSKELQAIYDSYRSNIERQHRDVENWMQAPIDPPVIESRLQFENGAVQLWMRFPVQIKQASQTDEQITQALLNLMAKDPILKAAITAVPVIQASVKG